MNYEEHLARLKNNIKNLPCGPVGACHEFGVRYAIIVPRYGGIQRKGADLNPYTERPRLLQSLD